MKRVIQDENSWRVSVPWEISSRKILATEMSIECAKNRKNVVSLKHKKVRKNGKAGASDCARLCML